MAYRPPTPSVTRCPRCSAHRVTDAVVCHKCGWRYDATASEQPPPVDRHAVARAEPTPVRLVPDPLEREQVARVVRALYEIGCVASFGALVGLLVGLVVGATVTSAMKADVASAAMGTIGFGVIGAWLGAWIVLRRIARDD